MLHDFIQQFPVIIPIISAFFSEILKAVIASVHEKRFAWEWFMHSGGMPSGHSAFVSSALMVVWSVQGIHSIEFLIVFVFGYIVIRDASGLRAQVGLHAHLLNALQKEYHLEKAVGHKLSQIIAGILVGVVSAVALMHV